MSQSQEGEWERKGTNKGRDRDGVKNLFREMRLTFPIARFNKNKKCSTYLCKMTTEATFLLHLLISFQPHL